MRLNIKNSTRKWTAILLIIASLFGMLDVSSIIAYAHSVNDGMIYCPNEEMVETKKTADPNGQKANGLVHGKTLYIKGEVTGTDGQLWYQVQYYTGSAGTTLNTAYCPANKVRLNSNAIATSTGVTNQSTELCSCSSSYKNPVLATLQSGTKVYITDTKSDNGTWYRVYCDVNGTRMYGWVPASSITVDVVPDLPTDASYEDQLRAKGFPESYVKPLAVLHEQYPNWVFNPVFINLDWNTVIAEESKSGRNLVHKDDNDARKSVSSQDYNWTTNKWHYYDANAWVAAHPDYIAYCMDPRNFLNSTNIFMFEGLSYSSVQTVDGVNAILKGSFMQSEVTYADGETINYANSFMTIGQNRGVSPYHLASRVRQEQGVDGTSSMISGTYPGYTGLFNFFNIKASGNGSELYERGLSHARTKGWTTRYLSLDGGAEFIASNYINVGQDTLYFQKFDVIATGGLYEHQYMTNVRAAISESSIAAKGYSEEAKQQSFTFNIPVYLNMPDTAVSFTASGNRNNYLSSLSVFGQSLTPTFSGATTNYSIIVESGVSSVSVSASPVVSTSKVSGTGTYNLNYGTNIINVNCKSQSGDTRTYTLTIVRQGAGNENYTLTSGTYNIGEYITGVALGTSAADFVAGFTCEGGSVKLLTATGQEHTGTVATGNVLAVYVNGALVAVKPVIIYGDVNGDGQIAMSDLLSINRHVIGTISLNSTYLKAGDVNRDGQLANMSDLLAINRHILGTILIEQ